MMARKLAALYGMTLLLPLLTVGQSVDRRLDQLESRADRNREAIATIEKNIVEMNASVRSINQEKIPAILDQVKDIKSASKSAEANTLETKTRIEILLWLLGIGTVGGGALKVRSIWKNGRT